MAQLDQEPRWRKSSRSGGSNCVEVAVVDGTVLVRDSKDPSGAWLCFTSEQWLTFLQAIRAGDLDAPF